MLLTYLSLTLPFKILQMVLHGIQQEQVFRLVSDPNTALLGCYTAPRCDTRRKRALWLLVYEIVLEDGEEERTDFVDTSITSSTLSMKIFSLPQQVPWSAFTPSVGSMQFWRHDGTHFLLHALSFARGKRVSPI